MEKIAEIQKITELLLEKLMIKTTFAITEKDQLYLIQIEENDDASLLIGKHGATLRSLQAILEAMLFKKFQEPVKILVNIGDYRERQKERVEEIAQQAATRVINENREAVLRFFSPFERKLIHEYITAKFTELTSYSEGEAAKRVLIIKKKEK